MNAREIERCPRCGSERVMRGTLTPMGRGGDANYFVPRDASFFRRKDGVCLRHGSVCCMACGLVWSSVDLNELQDFVEKYCDEMTRLDMKAALGLDDSEPHAPGTPEALIRAKQGVAEIDALVRADRSAEATRRCRELTSATWDQAIDALRHWRDLKTEQKLALFGWTPKDLPTNDEPGHPLHDAILDG